MSENGQVVIAEAMWKAFNEAKVIDALSSYLMTIEYVQFLEPAKRLVNGLYRAGFVICPSKPKASDLGNILPELKRYKDHPIVDAVRERLTQLYSAGLTMVREEYGEEAFRKILFDLLNAQREGGKAVEPLEVLLVEQTAKIIETDLTKAEFRIAPIQASPGMVERLVNESVKGSAIAMVLGEDTSRIGTIYRDMLEAERIR